MARIIQLEKCTNLSNAYLILWGLIAIVTIVLAVAALPLP
jgi:hypothetical protein